MLGLLSIGVAGCGNNRATQATKQSRQEQATHSSSQQKTVDIQVMHGQYSQAAGLVTIPFVIKNAGTNSTVIDSNKFLLKLDGYKIHPYQIEDEPSDFHQDCASNNIWQNTISFNIGTTLPQSELKKAKLYYINDNGKCIEAKKITQNISQTKTQSDINGNPITLGDYYAKVSDYLKQMTKVKNKTQIISRPV